MTPEERSVWDLLRNARVRFWTCPVVEHDDRRDAAGRPVVTVQWEGDTARCTAPGCGQSSAVAAQIPSPAVED